MTLQELFTKADKAMTEFYDSGIKCMATSTNAKQARFFRDFSQGQIDGVADFAMTMYLNLFYKVDGEEEAEQRTYKRFCDQIRERSSTLRAQLTENLIRYI